MAWRDKIAATSGRRQADYAWTVLARVLSWSVNRGLIGTNPCERGGRLYRGGDARREDLDRRRRGRLPGSRTAAPALAAACSRCGPGSGKATCCACRGPPMTARTSDCANPRLGARRDPGRCAAEGRARCHAERSRSSSPTATASHGRRTASAHRGARRARRAGIVGVTFHDLRGTAVTRLAICRMHRGGDRHDHRPLASHVRAILDTHYLHRDPALAESAIRKLERGTKAPD